MGVRIYLSNNQEALAQRCAYNLQQFKSVFAPVNIITQTAGMNRWLSVKIAETNGVFANFNYQSPNGLVQNLFYLAKLKTSEIFDTEKTRWIIYEILGSESFKNSFPSIAKYYELDGIKQLQLATKVADLFDQYFVYRPDIIETWNLGESYNFKKRTYIEHEKWQAYIWEELIKSVKANAKDKVTLKNELILKLEEPDFVVLLKEKIGGISLFGLSILTDFHVEIIYHLSKCINVDLYFLNPAPNEYWYDNKDENLISWIEKKTGKNRKELYLQEGNSLLSNFGKAGQNSFATFFNDSDFINAIVDENSIEPDSSTLLSHIQKEIYYNKPEEEREFIDSELLLDGTIQINSNYTVAREVEVLYNYLLSRFEDDPKLRPHDIQIMVTDIDKYSPYIQAIFDNSETAQKIPYSIADQSYQNKENLISAIQDFLLLSRDYFSAEKVLQLLDYKIIAEKFNLSNFNFLRKLLIECNIRFGISGNEEDHSKFISWKFGLEKIILSYSMSDDSSFFNGNELNYSINKLEGEKGREAIRFYGFANTIINLVLKRTQKRSLIEWKEYLEHVLEELIDLESVDNEEFNLLQIHLSKLNETQSHFQNLVSYDVFQNAFISSIFNNTRDGNFINGKLNFASMIPMRSIPFKVIGLLGLDRDQFPRIEKQLGFNLMEAENRRSDRNLRDNDKYLFLESILSAKQKLYLSYIGKNPRDNSNLPPSILVDELINYIAKGAGLSISEAKEFIMEDHPLHSYSKQYFTSNLKSYTAAIKNYKGIPLNHHSLNTDNFNTLNLESFLRFYQDPFKFYYNKVLGVYFDSIEDELPDSELFELNSLQKSILKDEILKADFDKPIFIDKNEKLGRLPLKNMALSLVNEHVKQLEIIKESLLETIENDIETHWELELKLNQYLLSGAGPKLIGNHIIFTHTSGITSRYKKEVQMRLLNLIIKAKQLPYKIILFDSNPEHDEIKLEELNSEDAKSRLEELCSIYEDGNKSIIPYHPISSAKYLQRKNINAAFTDLKNQGIPDERRPLNLYIQGEIEKGYFNNNQKTLMNQFLKVHELIFGVN